MLLNSKCRAEARLYKRRPKAVFQQPASLGDVKSRSRVDLLPRRLPRAGRRVRRCFIAVRTEAADLKTGPRYGSLIPVAV